MVLNLVTLRVLLKTDLNILIRFEELKEIRSIWEILLINQKKKTCYFFHLVQYATEFISAYT